MSLGKTVRIYLRMPELCLLLMCRSCYMAEIWKPIDADQPKADDLGITGLKQSADLSNLGKCDSTN